MVAEDAEGVACDSTGGYMEHGGKKLARHLVHIGDHEEQTLRSGVGGGKGTCVEAAVDSTCCAGLSLHLLHLDSAAEDVLLTLCRPLVNEICHGAGRGDGVYCRYLCKRIAYMCSCLVAVHCFEFSCHIFSSKKTKNGGLYNRTVVYIPPLKHNIQLPQNQPILRQLLGFYFMYSMIYLYISMRRCKCS